MHFENKHIYCTLLISYYTHTHTHTHICILWVSWVRVTTSAHLIKIQHKARGLLGELNLVGKERIRLGPYYDGPNSKIETLAEETTT